MLKALFDLFRNTLLLTRDVQENRKSVEDVRRELARVEEKLHQVVLMLHEERHEREKLALQLENVLTRFERRLPPGRPPKN